MGKSATSASGHSSAGGAHRMERAISAMLA
jgi:hypothetical protein